LDGKFALELEDAPACESEDERYHMDVVSAQRNEERK
jgi:hypothetical protein